MTMMETEHLVQKATEWYQQDPNPTTSAHVKSLIQEKQYDELGKLFQSRIQFGTAGLRAAMKAGPCGMNDLVVIQAAQGIAKFCLDQHGSEPVSVVIGYDHRCNPEMQLSSKSFALYSALVFQQAGIDCFLLDGYVATPMVPFCMSQIENAVLGIMVTASHNPKNDAGYKVYYKGCQIRPPVDQLMADSIMKNLNPWTDYQSRLQTAEALSQPERTREMVDKYMVAITNNLKTIQHPLDGARVPKFCYTAMHGVGYRFTKRAFESFGLAPFLSVPAQQEPDPAFPTVSFPNPEEAGALDMAKAYAQENGCNVVLANDPDADRLAVAELSKDEQKKWTVFTGDQIGVMLGHWLWEQIGRKSTKPVAMCTSTVSSKMLAKIAHVEGFELEETLTGFKWIGSRAAELNETHNSIFCYEEAIGFCCGNVIFDKDGVSAAAVFAELACSVYQRGETLTSHLQSLYDKYGEFVSCNGYYFMSDPNVVPTIFDGITNGGKFDRTSIGEYEIESVRYLGEPGYDSTTADKKPTLPTSKSSPMMTILFKNGCVVQLRASGTEPKFKYYTELPGQPGVYRESVQDELKRMLSIVLEELLHPNRYGLRTN